MAVKMNRDLTTSARPDFSNRPLIMQTADLHLKPDAAERWEALEIIVAEGNRRGISVLVIAGDMFDQNVDAEILRPRIREVLGQGEFSVLILPGNHDARSFREGLFFGDRVQVLSNLARPVEVGGVFFWGMPYEKLDHIGVRQKIDEWVKNRGSDKHDNVLVFHGELTDVFFSPADAGDEGRGYMPAELSFFNQTGLSYVLAGHFHTRFQTLNLSNGGFFVYSGSPVSVTRREIGQRSVNLFRFGEKPKSLMLNTFHYLGVKVELDPFANESPIDMIARELNNIHPAARPLIDIGGFINREKHGLTEQGLVEAVRVLAEKVCGELVSCNFRDIEHILHNDLFQDFLVELRRRGVSYSEEKMMLNLTIRAMMEVKL